VKTIDGRIVPNTDAVLCAARVLRQTEIMLSGLKAMALAVFSLLLVCPAYAAAERPLPGKRAFVEHYQGDFGNAKLAGCGLHNDSVFDPVLLPLWLNNRSCFEKVLQLKAQNGDNRVVVSPAMNYHGGQGGVGDLWHEPDRFAQFLGDIRAHTNVRGEPIEPLVIWIQLEHFGSFLLNGVEGRSDPAKEEHFARDIRAMANAVRDRVPGTAVCWECRDQRDTITPGAYARAARLIAQLFPDAWHGHHFISETSSASSWPCRDEADPKCKAEQDDPFRGYKPDFWVACKAEGWCDGLLYQFAPGGPYLNPAAHQNYTGHAGALGRYFEVVTRLGNDPQSVKTAAGNRHGWPQVDVIAFEFIYDAYNVPPGRQFDGKTPAQYAIEFCKRALALGGWGCGSASWRRPDR
jgi:hypothetical protein